MDSRFKIIKLIEDKKINRIDEIKEIFYTSSSIKNFRDSTHRSDFFEKWCGDYISKYPNLFYLVIDEKDNLMGYLSGMKNSNEALEALRVPGLSLYADLFDIFPAHFHINFHESSRGHGLGSELVLFYLDQLKQNGISGVHLITSPDSRNVKFYKNLGFNHIYIRENNGYETQFMGKKLT